MHSYNSAHEYTLILCCYPYVQSKDTNQCCFILEMFMECKGSTAVTTTVQDSSGLHKILRCLLSFAGQNNFFFFFLPQSKCSEINSYREGSNQSNIRER